MQVLVQGAVHALGYLEEGKYYREPDCYETLRDLIRYLRLDTPEMTARIQCGRHNVISQDLIPILKCDDDEMDDDLFDVAIRLLVNLCQPAIASLQGKPPEDRDQWQLYWTLEENLMRAKSAFSDVAFFVVLKTRLEKYFIHTEWADRVEDGRILMERIILLIRYILAIQPSNRDTKNILANNCHDRVVIAFLASDIDEVLLHISTQSAEKEFHVAIVDIFALLLQEHTPEDLLVSNEDLVAKERKAAEKELQSVRERESVKDVQRKTALNPRHSRFGGAYTLKGMKSASSSNDMIVLKPVKNTTNVTFLDERKKKKRTPKNRRPFETNDNTHTSSEELREALHSLVLKIVERAFNRIMKSAKQMVFELRAAAHRNTQIHYFQLMKFVLRFSRLAKLPLALVSCCVGVEAFHDAQLRLDNYLESAAVLKGAEAKAVGIKAQYALAAFDELILLHQYAAEKGDEREQTHAREAISHILRVEEYRELSPMLFAKFSPGVLSKVFLRELITTTHNYLRLLEKFVKRGDLKNVCKKTKVRRPRLKKSKEVFDEKAMLDVMTSEQLDGLWTEVEAEMSTLLADFQMGDEVSPVNFALDVVDDRLQQQFAMLTIQRKVRAKELTTAVTMYRTSRRLWPEDGVFGKDEMSADDELGEFREIFFANLLEVAIEMRKEEAKVSIPADTEEKDAEGDVDADDDGLSEDEEEDDRFQVTEVAFDFDSFVAKYAKSDVLQWYIFALNDFQTNSVELNKAIVKMLHRIAFDLQMASRIYQLSLFNVLMKVNEFFACIPSDEQKGSAFFELHTFGFHLLKKFFTAYQSGKDKLGLEVLFWKSAKESYEIDHGYGTFEKEKEESTQTWPEELEEEVRNLYIEYRDMDECPQDIDVLDFIEHNLSRGRTRKQIFKKLKELGLDSLGAKSKKRLMDSRFPISEAKAIHDEWKQREDSAQVDLADLVCEKLEESYGKFSRAKVIKELAFASIFYEKPVKPKSLPKWSDELVEEIKSLKEQYDELDYAELLLGLNIVDYVKKKLSEKKPSSQIERYLESLGVKIDKNDKKKSKFEKKKKKKEGTKAGKKTKKPLIVTGSDDEGGEDVVDKAGSGEEGSVDGDKENESSTDEDDVVDDELEASTSRASKLFLKSAPTADDGEKRTLQNLLDTKKRRFAQLMDSDESDDDSQATTGDQQVEAQETRQSASPDAFPVQPSAKRTGRVIVSSSDEDD